MVPSTLKSPIKNSSIVRTTLFLDPLVWFPVPHYPCREVCLFLHFISPVPLVLSGAVCLWTQPRVRNFYPGVGPSSYHCSLHSSASCCNQQPKNAFAKLALCSGLAYGPPSLIFFSDLNDKRVYSRIVGLLSPSSLSYKASLELKKYISHDVTQIKLYLEC